MNTKKTNECKVVALAIQKGGVAKTTSSVAMSAVLASEGYKVLLIDNDPQHNSTRALKRGAVNESIADVIDDLINFKALSANRGIVQTEEGFELLPSSDAYAGTEVRLMSMSLSREYFIKKYVDMVRGDYDYIIIDCPPNLGMLTINALVAADELLIPAQPQEYSATSIRQVLNTVQMIRQYSNSNLKVAGIFLTMFDGRRNEDNYMRNSIQQGFSAVRLYNTVIPYSVRVSEAARKHQSVVKYDGKGKVAEAYKNLVREVLQNG